MNVLIIATRYASLPNKNAGAIEKLLEQYLENKKDNNINYCIYSAIGKDDRITKNNYINTEFRYIDKTSFNYKIKRLFFGTFRKLLNINFCINEYNSEILKDIKNRNELKKYDLVIFENEINSIQYIKKNINSRIVSHIHNDYLNVDTKKSKKILDCCDEVWCVSKYISDRVLEIDSLQKNKIKILYNGIDINKFSIKNSNVKIDGMKKDLNIESNDFVVLYVGRLIKEKGVLELIRAFKKFSIKNRNTKLIIVGGNKINSQNENDNYIKKIKRISSNCDDIVFTGKISYDDISILYDIANVQVVPSLCNEAFGLVAAEGMAKGLPVIVSKSGGLTEIVDDKCGIIVERNNIVDEIFEALTELYNDNNIDKNYCLNKVKQFDIKEFSKNYENFIKENVS